LVPVWLTEETFRGTHSPLLLSQKFGYRQVVWVVTTQAPAVVLYVYPVGQAAHTPNNGAWLADEQVSGLHCLSFVSVTPWSQLIGQADVLAMQVPVCRVPAELQVLQTLPALMQRLEV